ILQQEEQSQCASNSAHHGQRVREARQIEPAQEARGQPLLTKLAQPLPVRGEVSGKKQDQQQLDYFHRLKGAEIHFRITARGAGAQRHQRHEQQKTRKERRVDPSREPAVIEESEERQQKYRAAQSYVPGELA